MSAFNLDWLKQSSTAYIELLLNRLLQLDAEAQAKLEKFSGKIIHLEITDLDLHYYFLFPRGTLVVQTHCEKKTAASISGKSAAFIAALTKEKTGDAIFSGELHFAGEVSTATDFQAFIQSLEIDWQQPISDIVGSVLGSSAFDSNIFGDAVAYSLSTAVTQGGRFLNNLFTNARQDIPEYLQHEIRITPAQAEMNVFISEVNQLRSQFERLQARVQQLKQPAENNLAQQNSASRLSDQQ